MKCYHFLILICVVLIIGACGDNIPKPMPTAKDTPTLSASPTTPPRDQAAVAFSKTPLNYHINRDYDQRLAVEIENQFHKKLEIVGELTPLGGGMLGGFVGRGSEEHPIALEPGASAVLTLALFAQDADQKEYSGHVMLKTVDTGQVIAEAPIQINVSLPKLALSVDVGPAMLGTLARRVTVTNEGDTLTDLTLRAGVELLGKIRFAPQVEHAYLRTGDQLDFVVRPWLFAGFHELDGNLILQGAGQEHVVPIGFELPPGKQIFVATGFSTTNDEAEGRYCTNNPDTDTPISGPESDSDLPWPLNEPRCVFRIPGTGICGVNTDGRTTWGRGPVRVDAGPTKGSDPRGDIYDAKVNVGDGNIGPFEVSKDWGVQVKARVGDWLQEMLSGTDSQGNSSGKIPRWRQLRESEEDPNLNYGTRNSPRGRRVRETYAFYRSRIYADNQPEARIAYGGTRDPVLLQTWHTDSWSQEGNQRILMQAWHLPTGRDLTPKPLALTDDTSFAQWPAVLALPAYRALVVWEQSPSEDALPSLVYRVSTPGYEEWSPIATVPGAEATDALGHYDPVPLLLPNGHVVLFWQEGQGSDAKIKISYSNDRGQFNRPLTPDGLPNGATRPIPRVGADGTLRFIFQAPVASTDGRTASAIYYAEIEDFGNTISSLKRLSPSNIDAGEADLLTDGSAIHVVYRGGPSWESRIYHAASEDGGASWYEAVAVTPDHLFAEYPTLFSHRDGGLAVEFYGGERRVQPEESLLKRFIVAYDREKWQAPQRVLTHFPTVINTWLQVNFGLNSARENYKPHEMQVLLNGHELIYQEDVIPEGTYLLPIDPGMLRFDENGLPANVISLRTRHMNRANYNSATGFRLQARHQFVEKLVIAASQAEADAILAAETELLNHSRADVGLFNNEATRLPASPEMGTIITLPLYIANLGEVEAREIRIGVYSEPPGTNGKPQGEAIGQVLSIEQLPASSIDRKEILFEYRGAENYYVIADFDGLDFDSSNNVHQVSFAGQKPPNILPIDDGSDNEVAPSAPGGSPYRGPSIRLLLGDWLPGPREVYGRWAIVPAGEPPDEQIEQWAYADEWVYADETLLIRSAGIYDVYWKQDLMNEPMLLAEDVQVERGQVIVPADSGIRLDVADWVPPFRGYYDHWWGVVQAGDSPEQPLQFTETQDVLMLPPGSFDVYWKLDYWNSPMLLAEDVQVEAGQLVEISVDSGIRLNVADWVPSLGSDSLYVGSAPLYSWWGVVQAGDSPEEPLQVTKSQDVLMLPPGTYDVYWKQDSIDEHMLLAKDVQVEAGQVVDIQADSGIRLNVADWVPSRGGDYHSWWGVVQAGDSPEELLQSTNDQDMMLLTPGRYDVYWKQDLGYAPVLLAEDVQVEAGHVVDVSVSGIHLQIPPNTPNLESGSGWWGIVPAGGPIEELIHRAIDPSQPLLVPPGTYDIIWDWSGEPRRIKEGIVVAEGNLVEVSVSP